MIEVDFQKALDSARSSGEVIGYLQALTDTILYIQQHKTLTLPDLVLGVAQQRPYTAPWRVLAVETTQEATQPPEPASAPQAQPQAGDDADGD